MFLDVKLPPRAAFTAQIIGTLFGSLLNFGWFFSYIYISEFGGDDIKNMRFTVIMNSIIDNQWSILLSVQGTNIWSGQQPQQYNSQAVAWGGLRYVSLLSIPLLRNFFSDRKTITVMNCLPLVNDTNSLLGHI